jgi:predicted methyltransferase
MFRSPASRLYGVLASVMFACAASLASLPARPADIYDDAVHHRGRSEADRARDRTDHPAELLRLAGIKPGMKVADVLGFGGYYSELASYVVGPEGHVLLLNNAAYDSYSNNSWRTRLMRNRLPNVEHRTVDLEHLDLPSESQDALLLIKVYHEIFWVDGDHVWPTMDPGKVLGELARVLKPGGTLLLVDHSAKPGTGTADAGSLHRIDEAYARHDFESHGFTLIGQSDVLRKPKDPRTLISFKQPMLGNTDRFVMVFRKPGG